MDDPAQSPRSWRTCPNCKRPVEPYYKFCEACGEKMPPLPVCRSCGALITAPSDYCEVCGAPFSAEETLESADGAAPATGEAGIPEPENAEKPYLKDDGISEGQRDNAEKVADEIPAVPGDIKPKRQYSREIVEPDTEEILEKFSDGEFGPETPGPAPPAVGEGARKLINSALFLLEQKPPDGTPERAGSRLKTAGLAVAILAVLAIVFFIHLPLLSGGSDAGTPAIPSPAPTPVQLTPAPVTTTNIPATAHAVTTSSAFVTLPTQALPTDQKVYFMVRKSPITARITVIFTGSSGADGIQSAEVTVTHPSGSVASGIILPLKGITEIVLEGSKEPDRVEIIATMSTGEKYRVYDELVTIMDY